MKYGFGLRVVATVLILASVPTLALAYIDPGNGAYMLQALMTVVAAGMFYLRHPLRTMKAIGRWLSGSLRRHTAVADVSDSDAAGVSGQATRLSRSSEEL